MQSYVTFFYYFVVICSFFLSTKCEKSTKLVSDIQTVCEKVVKTSRLWGSKIIQFKPQCSQRYRGISSKVLSMASLLTAYSDLNKTSCYNPFEGPLCYVQFNQYEASPECGDTVDLFFNMLKTCFNRPENTAGSCPTLDGKNSYLIGDPQAFCRNAYLEQDGPENPKTGLPTTSTKRNFRLSEIEDCNQIVTAYNSCVYFGQKILGYPPQFCMSLSFDAYCHNSVQIIEDPQYRLACKNVVVPALMEYLSKHHRPVDQDFCSTLYQRSLVFLAAKKGEAYTWIRKMSNNLQLTAAPLQHVNLLKKPLLKARVISLQYYSAINETEAAFNRMYNSGTHTIPYALLHEFNLLKSVVDEIYQISLKLKLPEAIDTEKVLETVPIVNGELEKLCDMKEKAIVQHGDFRSKLSQWLVKSAPYNSKTLTGTYTLPYSSVAAIQNTVAFTVNHINDFTHHYSTRLNLWPAKIMKNDAKYVYEGIRQLRLAKLRDMQIKLLISLYFQTNADTFVANILSKNSV